MFLEYINLQEIDEQIFPFHFFSIIKSFVP